MAGRFLLLGKLWPVLKCLALALQNKQNVCVCERACVCEREIERACVRGCVCVCVSVKRFALENKLQIMLEYCN